MLVVGRGDVFSLRVQEWIGSGIVVLAVDRSSLRIRRRTNVPHERYAPISFIPRSSKKQDGGARSIQDKNRFYGVCVGDPRQLQLPFRVVDSFPFPPLIN